MQSARVWRIQRRHSIIWLERKKLMTCKCIIRFERFSPANFIAFLCRPRVSWAQATQHTWLLHLHLRLRLAASLAPIGQDHRQSNCNSEFSGPFYGRSKRNRQQAPRNRRSAKVAQRRRVNYQRVFAKNNNGPSSNSGAQLIGCTVEGAEPALVDWFSLLGIWPAQ